MLAANLRWNSGLPNPSACLFLYTTWFFLHRKIHIVASRRGPVSDAIPVPWEMF